MDIFNTQVVILIIGSLSFALIGLWSARHGRARLLLVGIFTAMVAMIFNASANLMGQAKPINFTFLQPQAGSMVIISSHLMEGRGIYLTLNRVDTEPLLYVLPWDEKTAQQLLDAMEEAKHNGTQAMMKMPRGQTQLSQNEEPPFYAQPQVEPPAKASPGDGIRLG